MAKLATVWTTDEKLDVLPRPLAPPKKPRPFPRRTRIEWQTDDNQGDAPGKPHPQLLPVLEIPSNNDEVTSKSKSFEKSFSEVHSPTMGLYKKIKNLLVKLPADERRELLLSLARECSVSLASASLPVKDASPSTTPEQVTRAKQEARLAGLRLRYQEMSESIALPPTGFESEEQRKAASALASAFHDIHELERKLGYELTTIDPILREANRLKKADQRAKNQNSKRKSVKPIASTQPR